MIERLNKRTARIGMFGVAHPVYWDQFPGLEDTLMGFHAELKEKVAANEVEVIDFGMVDTNEKAFEALDRMKGAKLDVLF